MTVARRLTAILIAGLNFALPAAGLATTTAAGTGDASLICEAAAQEAAAAEGVPLSVLLAISLNETGRKRDGRFRPWPWTVNMEGAGHWFDDRQAALDFAMAEFDRGARSFDVGCFQINYKYHGMHFASIEQMFDPGANAHYAARFLRDLYREKGDWQLAAGAYHSRTPDLAERYAARFQRFREGLVEDFGEEVPRFSELALASLLGGDAPPRINSFPLLKAGEGQGLGSLVPVANGAGIGLFGPAVALPEVRE
jgi:hypothetical protein